MTKFHLFSLLAQQGTALLTLPDGRSAILLGIEREDGSGSSFNLQVVVDGRRESVYVRTID